MYAVSNSLAHRAQPATRTRVRWQPYAQGSSSASSASASSSVSSTSISCRSPPSSSASSYLNTPASSVFSPPTTHIHTDTRPTAPSTAAHIQKETQSRESNKQKYALGLVDQAVKSLGEIWHPQDIPAVFLTSSRATVTTTPTPTQTLSKLTRETYRRNVQLPSPISPSTSQSPSPLSTPSPASRKPAAVRSSDSPSSSTLVPIKGFVHEVLRRSRTSACVLQTALCYLEAIRSKVPDLVRQEKLGYAAHDESEFQSRVISECDAVDDASSAAPQASVSSEPDLVPTVRVTDCSSFDSSLPDIQGLGKKISPSPSLPPLPPLPSPLLCPRRAFLASLILASKFTQDKCYSNRAWAKLSGLPPREIGRCERALGDALDWRLWVGKVPQPAPASTSNATTRPVVRSHSDGAVLSTSIKSEFTPTDAPSVTPLAAIATPSVHRGLRRCATLPTFGALDGVSNWIHGIHGTAQPSAPPPPPDVRDCGNESRSSSWYWNPQTSLEPTSYCEDNVDAPFTQSPIPATPPLTLSPSSTESSSGGDRTVQMAFLDESSAYDANAASCCSDTSAIWIQGNTLGSSATGTMALTGSKLAHGDSVDVGPSSRMFNGSQASHLRGMPPSKIKSDLDRMHALGNINMDTSLDSVLPLSFVSSMQPSG